MKQPRKRGYLLRSGEPCRRHHATLPCPCQGDVEKTHILHEVLDELGVAVTGAGIEIEDHRVGRSGPVIPFEMAGRRVVAGCPDTRDIPREGAKDDRELETLAGMNRHDPDKVLIALEAQQ